MDIKERREFYEKVYFYELDKPEKLYARLRLPLAILIFIIPINFFLISEVITSISDGSIISVVLIISISSLLILLYLLYCIYRMLTGWTYYEVSLKDFDEHYGRLIEYYKKWSDEDRDKQKAELMARETFEKDLTQQLVECTNHNQNLNLVRSAYIIKLIKILPYYTIFIALSYVFLLFKT
ncbi:MAG: hypothetical protein GDA45_06510 [Chromatiales bacterium]|nr:hypothetical protein [Chromatiales bacterium]